MRSKGRAGRLPQAYGGISLVTVVVITTIMWVLAGLSAKSVYAGQACACDSEIVIEADTTEYQFGPEGTVVVAEGNARVSYTNFLASADYIRVQLETGELLARGNVEVYQGSRTIRCDLLAHNIYTGNGRILEPDAYISDLHVRGSKMDLEPGILTLDKAYVTGCELDQPCYRVQAKKLIIYPDDRVVIEWPVFRLGNVPVMALPRLTLPLRGDRIAFSEGGGIPIPTLSYDSSDGFQIGFTYLDTARDWGKVRYEGAYASKYRGVKLRAEAELALGSGKTGLLAGQYASWKGFSGSADYLMSLSNSVALNAGVHYVPVDSGDGSSRWRGFEPGAVEAKVVANVDQGRVHAKATVSKDILSTGDVYRLPEIEVSIKPISAPGGIGSLNLSAGFGRFEEPKQAVIANRSYVSLSFASKGVQLSTGVNGSLSLGGRRAWYETGDVLDSFTAGAKLQADFGKTEAFGAIVPRAKAGLSYDFTRVRGTSPFAFDEISPQNKASANVDYRVNEDWSIGVSTTYDFTDRSVKDIGVLLVRHNHCYNIQAEWHKEKQTFGIEVTFLR